MTMLLLLIILVPGVVTICYPLFIRRILAGDKPAFADQRARTISVIVPCCGLETRMTEKITAVLAQKFRARAEILFCVESAQDPAVAVLEPLLCLDGDTSARLVITGPAGAELGKVHNLIAGYDESCGERLVFLDSDVLLPDDHYLSRFIAGLEQTGVGLVTCFPAYREFRHIPAAILAFMINNDLLGLFAVVGARGRLSLANGSCLAVPRGALAAAGGLRALRQQLLMDTALARNIRQAGYTVHLHDEGAPVVAGGLTLAQVRQQSQRWHLAMWRVLPPLHYLGYAWLRGGLLLGLAGFFLFGRQPLVAAALIFTLAARGLMAGWIDHHHLHSGAFGRYCWLLPLVELMNGWEVLTAPLGRRVRWRGRSYSLDRYGRATPTGREPT